MKALVVASLAIACLACFVLVGADAQEKAELKADDSTEVAREIVQELETAFRIGGKRPPDEQLFIWSRRLAEAEHSDARDATAKQAALAAHAERMKALEERTKASFATGTTSRIEVLAATYYRITADEWSKRGR